MTRKKQKWFFIAGLIAVTGISLVITFVNNLQFENEMQRIRHKDSYPVNISLSIEHKELKKEGYSVHYFVSGNKQGEAILFLHPAFADHRCFDRQIDFFGQQYRVITMDMLGHGLSHVGDAKDKIDATVNHIDEILQREGYARVHIVGVSMGSLIAQYYGLVRPAMVESMTILGGYDINADNAEIARAQRWENVKWLAKALFSMKAFRRHVSTVSVSRPEEQARFYEMASLYTRKSFMVMSGLGKVLQQREGVKRSYPLLILTGDKDIELARRMSEKWHISEPSSRYHIIENAGHCANMDNARVFNKLVFDFIGR